MDLQKFLFLLAHLTHPCFTHSCTHNYALQFSPPPHLDSIWSITDVVASESLTLKGCTTNSACDICGSKQDSFQTQHRAVSYLLALHFRAPSLTCLSVVFLLLEVSITQEQQTKHEKMQLSLGNFWTDWLFCPVPSCCVVFRILFVFLFSCSVTFFCVNFTCFPGASFALLSF